MRFRNVLLSVLTLAWLGAPAVAQAAQPSVVTAAMQDGAGQYTVNGQPALFVGMGYNPIYRFLPEARRAEYYRRDFSLLCQAGVNTITGWDADKGYQQDTFDDLTLDTADQYGIGVIMPFYLPADGDYNDPDLLNTLVAEAKDKIYHYRDNPALRMWGVGNEVLNDMPDGMQQPFLQFYLQLADLFHALDPNHPVIYRGAEDTWIPMIASALQQSGDMRPWLLYGMNIYNPDVDSIVNRWPGYGLNRPLFISEFGPDGVSEADRAEGYAQMWSAIRGHSDFILGAAPYVWTTAGPEPTDAKWGLMNVDSQPIDGAFSLLSDLWRQEPLSNHSSCH